MAEPRTIQVGISGTSTVESYTLAPGLAQFVESVYVEIDNTAGADAQPLVTLSDQSGVVIAKKRQGDSIAAGDTGSGGGTGSLGPYGTSASPISAVRQRWAIVLRIRTVATPSAVYSTRTAEKVIHTPLAPVTASLVRMTL